MATIDWLLLGIFAVLTICIVKLWRDKQKLTESLQTMQDENSRLKIQLEEAVRKVADLEAQLTNQDSAFSKIIDGLVSLGVPGLLLLVAMAVSGWAGAAAITTGLATLGGPLGMLGGIAVLILLAKLSPYIARHGLPYMAGLVVKGLIGRGMTVFSIRDEISRYPQWLIPSSIKSRIEQVLQDETSRKALPADGGA